MVSLLQTLVALSLESATGPATGIVLTIDYCMTVKMHNLMMVLATRAGTVYIIMVLDPYVLSERLLFFVLIENTICCRFDNASRCSALPTPGLTTGARNGGGTVDLRTLLYV
jgi:hypothetical protein